MKNPFRYGAKVTGGAFYDRREIKASMMNALDGCNNVVLYGPRRYGKSSLVAEMIEELRENGVICVYLNMMNVASLGDFVMSYSKAVYGQFAPTVSARIIGHGISCRHCQPLARRHDVWRRILGSMLSTGNISC